VVWGKVSNLIFRLMLVYTLDWESHSFMNSWIYYTSFLLFCCLLRWKNWSLAVRDGCDLRFVRGGDITERWGCCGTEVLLCGGKENGNDYDEAFPYYQSVCQSINSTRFTYPLPYTISFLVYIILFPFLRPSSIAFPPN
jgi:hypothetical protein